MQAKNILPIVLSVAVMLVVVVGLVLLPPSAARRGSRQILQSVDQAGLAWHEASSLLGNPFYRSPSGELSPLPARIKETRSGTIAQKSLRSPNPKALEVLKKGEAPVLEALEKHPKASPVDRAVGLQMLGRFDMLRGAYYQRQATQTRWRLSGEDPDDETDFVGVYQSLEVALAAANSVHRQAQAVAFFEVLAAADTSKIEEMKQDAHKRQETVRVQTAEKARQIAARQQTIATFEGQIDTRSAEAQTLRAASRDAETAAQGQPLRVKALAIEAKIHELRNKIAATQREADLLGQEHSHLLLQQSAAAKQIRDCDAALTVRRQEIAKQKANAQTARTKLDQAQQALGENVDALAAALDTLAAAEAQAVRSYQEALDHFEQAKGLAETVTPRILSEQAETRMAIGAILAGEIQLRDKVDHLAGQITWALATVQPPVDPAEMVGKVSSYLADRDAALAEAREQLTKAAAAFDQAIDEADSDRAWAYRAESATAQFSLYQLTGDAAHLTKAKQLHESARTDHPEIPPLAPGEAAVARPSGGAKPSAGGAGDPDEAAAKATTRRFMTNMNKVDKAAVLADMTDSGKAAMGVMMDLAQAFIDLDAAMVASYGAEAVEEAKTASGINPEMIDPLADPTSDEQLAKMTCQVDGDKAVCVVPDEPPPVVLVRQGGKWLVDMAATFSMPPEGLQMIIEMFTAQREIVRAAKGEIGPRTKPVEIYQQINEAMAAMMQGGEGG
ncbi:MAG TPA: hypothetical protein ENH80_00990 [Phycisphaerae bacterium]|nr:hypothetical protein [Phycisphaerae bacterium]HDZ42494.1 hypothetical protein [Phycisphaerae bacterium]